MHINENHPTTRIPGPSSNLVKCANFLGFTLLMNGTFLDHRGISFCIYKVGKDIIGKVIHDAWNRVVTKQVSTRKEWSFIKDFN